MLQKEATEKLKGFNQNVFTKHQSQSAVQDLVLSISHRLSLVEAGLNSKIDRSQCMLILESKANFSQIKKIAEQLSSKAEFEKKIAEQKLIQQQKENKKEVEKLKQKLKCRKKQDKKSGTDKNIFTLKPQELYLESNETMFSIIVDQISALKQAQQVFQKSLQQRNKVTLNLNNEVCSKIQTLQRQIQTSLKTIKQIRKQPTLQQSRQSWSNSEQLQSRVKQSSKNNFFHKTESNNPAAKTCTELHQTSHILRTIQNLQKQISTKINIKDVLPIIRKNLQPISISIEEVRKYCEEAIESTKKILINQSEINQELCAVSKIGWWHSFQEKNGIAVWNKQIANLVPEIFSFIRESNQIELIQQGTYIIKMLGEELPQTIIVGNQQLQMLGQTLIKVQKNTVLQVPSSGGQIFLTILKI